MAHLRTMDRLDLYVSTQFKNSSDVKQCVMHEKADKLAIPDLADNHTAHKNYI